MRLALIMAAIHLSQPSMEQLKLQQYALTVREEGASRAIDPLTIVSLVHNESRWISTVVGGRDGLCVGLGQHCLFDYSYCRANYQSAECLEKKQKLLDGVYNLKETALRITEWRKFCKEKTGHAALYQWLAAYQGYNDRNRGIWCGQRKIKGRWQDVRLGEQTRNVIEYRKHLLSSLTQKS